MSASADAVSSLWLLPAADDERMFSGVVNELSTRHGNPPFHPHLTILGDIPKRPGAFVAATNTIARAAAAFAAPVADIRTGDAYFRSFYALFDRNPPLDALRAAAGEATGSPATPFMPHVSLLYGDVAEPAKSQSAADIRRRLAGRTIRFDRLALTNSANDAPLTDWRILHVAPLAG